VESIRKLQREVVAGVPVAEYLETRALLHSPRGALLRQVPGRKSRVRQADGIHFTSEGGRYFALQVAPLLRERLERMEAAVSSASAP
jgi:hypothetical protein